MPGRMPQSSDFPPTIKLSITPPPPSSSRPTNILILLHGLGDSHTAFTQLGKQFALPETACLAIQGPSPLPFDIGGFHWGDDITFDQASGQMDLDTGLVQTSKTLGQDVIQNGLIGKCGYRPREIVLFGLGQGGMAALAAATSLGPAVELGGVVSLGGPAARQTSPSTFTSTSSAAGADGKSLTPVLILGGSSGTEVTRSGLDTTKAAFRHVEYHKWQRAGDGMPVNREEMLPIMRFFARRLRSQQGVPGGSVELG